MQKMQGFSQRGLLALFFSGLLTVAFLPGRSLAQECAYLLHIDLGPGWQKTITLTNPGSQATNVKLSVFDRDGTFLGEIPGISSFAAETTQTFQVENILPSGSETIKVDSTANVVAVLTVTNLLGTKSETIPAIEEASSQLDFPRLFRGDQDSKTITLLNANPAPLRLQVVALDEAGFELQRTSLAALLPMSSRTLAVKDLFSAQIRQQLSTTRVISDGTIFGLQLVDPPAGDLVALPALSTTSRGWSLPIGSSGGGFALWTTVGFLNPGDFSASVAVEAFDSAGNSIGIIDRAIIAPGATHFLTTSNVGGTIPRETATLKVTADESISNYEVIGVIGGVGVTATLGIPAEDTATAGFALVGSKDGGMLGVAAQIRMANGNVSATGGRVGTGGWNQTLSPTTTNSGRGASTISGNAASPLTAPTLSPLTTDPDPPPPPVVDVSLRQPEIVNSLLSLLAPPKSTCAPLHPNPYPITTDCNNPAAGVDFKNIGNKRIRNLFFEVVRLDGPSCAGAGCKVIVGSDYVLKKGDGGPGSLFTIPQTGDLADGSLTPGETFKLVMAIQQSQNPPGRFVFSINIWGTLDTGADSSPFCCGCGNRGPCPDVPGGSAISLAEGNLKDLYPVSNLKSAFGPTVDFSLAYNSYNADNSRAGLDTGLGLGWTHSYNIFLFSQQGNMFRSDGSGRVTKYQPSGGGNFTPTNGYFETLVQNPDGSFDLRQKDGITFHFAFVSNTPFLTDGTVYRLRSIIGRNEDPLTSTLEDTTTLEYDANGNLSRIMNTYLYGRSLTLGYNGQNKLVTVTDPLARVTTFTYDSTGTQLLTITDPQPKSVQYSYNSANQLIQKIDKDGRVFSYLYQSGKPVAIQDGAPANLFSLTNPGNWAINDTSLANNLLREYIPSTSSKTDGRGNLWRYDYDNHGYITRMIAPDGATTIYNYDPSTLMVASMTDANNHTTSYQYDTNGNLIKKTDPNPFNYVTTYTYESTFNQMTSMTDANGRITTYSYEEVPNRGNRTKEIDPLRQTRQWTYDSHGNVLTEKDKRTNTTMHVYDSFGNRIQTTDREGHVWTMTYDTVGNLLTRTDPLGHITQYTYDGLNRLTKETKPLGDPLQADTKYFYDGEGNRKQVIDRDGNSTSYDYDLRQRLITITDAQPKSITQTYDGNNNRASITDKNGHKTNFDYDVQNRLVNTTDAENNSSSMTYDPVGNKLSDTDANLHATFYTYDELNRLKTRTDAEGFVMRMEYDMVGTAICAECTGPTKGSSLIFKQIDGNLKVTYFTYDALDRLVKQIRKQTDTTFAIDADDAVTTNTYDPNNNRLTLTEPNLNKTSYEYDKLDRQIKMTNAAGDMTLTSYDLDGNVASVTAPNLNVTTNSYDTLDRLIQVDDSVGRVANYTYDPVGNRLTDKDGNGNSTTNTYDTIYRLTDVTDALGQKTHFDYDAVGNLLKTTDREFHVTMFDYDKINRRIKMTDALGNVTQYQYDGVGNLKQITDANIHATSYDYDKINRPLKETYADGRMRTFGYDAVNLIKRTDQKGQVTNYIYNDLYFLLKRSYPVSPADNMTYDLSGRMLTAERGGWLVTFQYDGANRVIQTKENGQPITYVYNIPGRTRMVTYPGGRMITEQTDFRSRLDHINDSLILPIVQYVYDLGNRVGTRTYRNGTVANYTYNANNWILTLDHTNGATEIAGFTHNFDNEGNKRFEQKSADAASSDTRSEAYQYDKTYRLIDYKVGTLVGSTVPVPTTQTQYDLDGVGNWNKKTKDGVPENRTHDLTNEITQIDAVPVLSDFNGNTNEDGLYRYNYDDENRLIRVIRKSDKRVVGRYEYDALSRRVKKIADPANVSSPVETRYFYDGARIIEEQNPAMVTLATYVYGNYIDEVLTMDRGVQTFFYHQNSLSSVEAITDNLANVVERYSYDAYGLPTILNGAGVPIPINSWDTPHSAIGNPWMFTGRQFDEETGVYFYRARYYDPVKGRFLQRDPLGYVNGMNLYAYASNSPTGLSDPFGLCVEEDVCGPDVTSALFRYLVALKVAYDKASPTERATACENLYKENVAGTSWDILELHEHAIAGTQRKKYYGDGFENGPAVSKIKKDYPFCSTGKCLHTVMVGGNCFEAGAVNYVIFGEMNRHCFNESLQSWNTAGWVTWRLAGALLEGGGIMRMVKADRETVRRQVMLDAIYYYKGGFRGPKQDNYEASVAWALAGWNKTFNSDVIKTTNLNDQWSGCKPCMKDKKPVNYTGTFSGLWSGLDETIKGTAPTAPETEK